MISARFADFIHNQMVGCVLRGLEHFENDDGFRRVSVIKDERLREKERYDEIVFFFGTAATAHRKWEQIFVTNDKSRTSLQKQTTHFCLFDTCFFIYSCRSILYHVISSLGLCTLLSIFTVKRFWYFFCFSNWMQCSGSFQQLT